MAVRKIYYTPKTTVSHNVYITLEHEDYNWLITKLITMNSFMAELSLSSHRDVKDLIKYWTSSNTSLPFNSYLKKKNSPCSYVAGILNNVLFGEQRDLSEIQVQYLQGIITQYQGFVDAVEADLGLHLQKSPDRDTVLFVQQLFEKG